MARKLNELQSASELVNNNIILLQQDGVDKQATLANIATFVFDMIIPVGFVYTQFPNTSDPSTLGWPGTWTNVSSDYAGDFFRAEGGNALAFESGEQVDAFQGHRHRAIVRTINDAVSSQAARGAQNDYPVVSDSLVMDPISDGVNGTPRTASETRPINRTIRIWKRTA